MNSAPAVPLLPVYQTALFSFHTAPHGVLRDVYPGPRARLLVGPDCRHQMTMKLEQAIALVEKYLRDSEAQINAFGSALPGYINPNIKLQILKDDIEAHEFGWVFHYDPARHIETGDFQDGLVGNAPLIVDRHRGQIVETGTARETDYYVNNYIRNGDPNDES